MKKAVIFILCALLSGHAHAAVKPNIIIIILAAQGMRFTDAHTSSGVCSPSRYSLLTGRYHWRSRLQTGIVGYLENLLFRRAGSPSRACSNSTATARVPLASGTLAGISNSRTRSANGSRSPSE
jgi:arylsulfatase A-like enzyme